MTRREQPGRVIVFGLMFDLPYAGIIVQFLHYLLGLRRLGWDVWYVEDSLSWPYDPVERTASADPIRSIETVSRTLERFGFGDRWIYRCAVPDVRCFGAGPAALAALYRDADLVLNVTGAQEIRDEHEAIRRLVYVQSDPFGLQVDIENGDEWAAGQLGRHDVHFSFGELVGTASCDLPTAGVQWLPTRQPVALELWPNRPPGDRFTTVTTWRNNSKEKVWNGVPFYWTKDREFLSVIDLPRHTAATLELAIDGVPDESAELIGHGWHLARRPDLTDDFDAYRGYILESRGEFTAARDQVVRPRTGWFSDRSASYLAAGRAVVTQETGFSEDLPTGDGLFAFTGVDDAAAALNERERDPQGQGASARAIAEEYFAAERVLGSLISRAASA